MTALCSSAMASSSLALAREDDAVDVVAIRVLGCDLHALRQLLDGFLTVSGHFQKVAEIDVCGAVVGVEFDGLPDLRHGVVEASGFSQCAAEIVMRLRAVVVHCERLVVRVDRIAGFAAGGKRNTHVVPGSRVGWIFVGSNLPCGDSVGVFVRILKLLRDVELAIEVDCGCLDVVEIVGTDIHELGNIDGAVGSGGVFNDDGRAGVALVVDVGEIEMGIERRALRGKCEPVAVGVEGVPRVHHAAGLIQAGAPLRLQMARCRACCRDASAGRSCTRTKTIHLPSGETLGKLLLIPFSEAPTMRSGVPPLPSLNGIL